MVNNTKKRYFNRIILSPYVKIVDADSRLIKLLLYNANKMLPKNAVILLVYNAIFNRVDEFIGTRQKLVLLLSMIEESDKAHEFLINPSENVKINEISTFYKQCLFDGIVTLK